MYSTQEDVPLTSWKNSPIKTYPAELKRVRIVEPEKRSLNHVSKKISFPTQEMNAEEMEKFMREASSMFDDDEDHTTVEQQNNPTLQNANNSANKSQFSTHIIKNTAEDDMKYMFASPDGSFAIYTNTEEVQEEGNIDILDQEDQTQSHLAYSVTPKDITGIAIPARNKFKYDDILSNNAHADKHASVSNNLLNSKDMKIPTSSGTSGTARENISKSSSSASSAMMNSILQDALLQQQRDLDNHDTLFEFDLHAALAQYPEYLEHIHFLSEFEQQFSIDYVGNSNDRLVNNMHNSDDDATNTRIRKEIEEALMKKWETYLKLPTDVVDAMVIREHHEIVEMGIFSEQDDST